MYSQHFYDEWKRLHKEKYGIILSDEQAYDDGTKFLNLMKLLIVQPREIAEKTLERLKQKNVSGEEKDNK